MPVVRRVMASEMVVRHIQGTCRIWSCQYTSINRTMKMGWNFQRFFRRVPLHLAKQRTRQVWWPTVPDKHPTRRTILRELLELTNI
jgi:hypothetical protein